MKIDWNEIDPYEFESLCYDILGREGYIERDWFGVKGSDRGRDIVCKKIYEIVKGTESIKSCLVQCKRYIAKAPSISDLSNTLNWAISSNKYDVVIFMISNTVNSDTRDYIKGIEQTTRFSIELIEEKYFEIFFDENHDLYDEYFIKKKYAVKNIVLNSLCNDSKSMNEIHKETKIPIKDIRSFTDYYENKGIIYHESDNKLVLQNDDKSFIEISKDLLSSYYNFNYMKSIYLNENIDQILINILESKLSFNLDDEYRESIIKLTKVSPSTLYYILFNDFVMFKEGINHLKLLNMDENQQKKWIENFISNLMLTLLEKTISDSHNIYFKDLLIENNLDAFKIDINFKLASIEKLELEVSTGNVITLMQIKGGIKAGQLVTADVDGVIRMAGLALNLQEYDASITLYEDALKKIEDNDVERYIVINNNIGICLLRMKQWIDALPYFNNILEIEPNHKETLKNKKLCKSEIDKIKKRIN